MAVSEVASSAHSDIDMDGDDSPQWTFKIDDDSPAPHTDHPVISSLDPVALSTATKVPYTADLSLRPGPYQVYEAERESYEDARNFAVGDVMDRVRRTKAEEEEGGVVISLLSEERKHNRFL